MNKFNYRLLKKMSMAFVLPLFLGSFSTVWMSEQPNKSFNEIKNEFQNTSAAISLGKFKVERKYARKIKKAIKNKIPKDIYQSDWGSIAEYFSEDVATRIVSSNTAIYRYKIDQIATAISDLFVKFTNEYDGIISKFSK